MSLASLVVMIILSVGQAPSSSTVGDRVAVEAATLAYRDAWLSNDPQRIMSTLTRDAVLYPSTLPPLAGSDAIRAFWFPPSSPTRVVAMELTIDRVHVDGDTAVTSGMGSLTFVVTTNGVDGAPRAQRSWHVNVLRRQANGSWLIWKRMWGDVR
jgi:ketosteroid isomerase-like protein